MADIRAAAGDRELLPGGGLISNNNGPAAGRLGSARAYRPLRPGEKDYIDDLAWYEGRYPDESGAAPGGGGVAGGARERAVAPRGRNARSFLPSADEP
jgi:hypothetical protein